MKTYLKKVISLAISFVMLLCVTNVTLFFEADAATYEERGTLTFGSVDITLTELVENDYKVTVPVTFDQDFRGDMCNFSFLGFLQNGLNYYNCKFYGDRVEYASYNEELGVFIGMVISVGESNFKKGERIADVTVVVPSTASAGDKFTVRASKTGVSGKDVTWGDTNVEYSFKNVIDGIITIKPDPLTSSDSFSTGFIGRGTSDSPYLISSADDLVHLSELINNPATNPYCRNAYYKQTADIDMSGVDFTPIGKFYGADNITVTENAVFSGDYNGDKHKITNLKVKSYSKYCGLFGRIGESYATENACKVHHLSVYGDISSSNSVVGGIVGEIGNGASVVNCSFHGSVTGSDYVGGIAGSIYEGGNIQVAYTNGNVKSSGLSSGIVASVNIGNYSGSKNASIKSCYTNAALSGSETYAIASSYKVGNKADVSLTLENNYFSSNTSESGIKDDLVGCTRLSDVALKACADMLSGEFSSDLDMINDGYPVFEWELSPYQFKGSGTISDPYQIGSKEDLFGLQRNVAVYPGYYKAYYIQTSDIDMENEMFTPIGLHENHDYGLTFKGCYNGNNHTIKNFNINWQGDFAVGLFSATDSNALIKNLVVYGEVHGSKWTGGVVGSADKSTVENCAFIGNVSSDQFDAGGIVGKSSWNGGLNIISCYHNGTVTGGRYASGILGSSGETIISKGKIEVYNSYHANGKIKAESTENSYGIAAVNMEFLNERCGDKAKDYIPDMIVSNCYVTTGLASNIGCPYASSDNTTALIQSQMKQIAPDLGEAFVTNTDETLNNGYPVFKWQASTIKGDVNRDGEFDVSDLVLFQKWLLAVPDVKLSDWKAVDYTGDGILDAFDLCLMRKALTEA